MSEDTIAIRRGLPDGSREEAAVLFDEAFGAELNMSLPHGDKRLAFLARAFATDRTVVALRGRELVGMVGLSASEGRYRGGLMDVTWDPRPFHDLLGVMGSIRAVVGLVATDHKPERGELWVDGIAVSAQARGQGIGTRLLGEVASIAREDGFRWVRLDVADINPRAQALYERVGYKVTRVQSFRYMRRFIGFGGMTSMELAVGAASVGGEAR